jgi:hypothetical protein
MLNTRVLYCLCAFEISTRSEGNPVRFAEIWFILMLMLICCEKKILFRSLESTVDVGFPFTRQHISYCNVICDDMLSLS